MCLIAVLVMKRLTPVKSINDMAYNRQREGVEISSCYPRTSFLMAYNLLKVSNVIHPTGGRSDNAMPEAVNNTPLILDIPVWDV